MSSQTNVASFVLRFVQETATDSAANHPRTEWRGVIKHVQSSRERHFTCFSDAVAFMANYVDLDTALTGSVPSPVEKGQDDTAA